MLTLLLPSGTEVAVDGLRIRQTYAGQFEGSRESISRFILKRLASDEEEGGFQLIRSATPLPRYQCEVTLASLDSGQEPTILSARLQVVWFTAALLDSIAELLEPVRLVARFDVLARSIDLDNL